MPKRCVVVDLEEPFNMSFMCKDCGSLVFDTKLHDAWHEKEGF